MSDDPKDALQDDRPEADPVGSGREAEQPTGSDSELEDTKRERDEYLDLAQRAKADFENYRKRTQREAADGERRGKLALAREIVPSIDSLERALAAADPESDIGRGLAIVHAELVATLGRAGVEAYDPVGEPFDPSFSEVVATRPGDGKAGTVIETLDRGYRSDGTVLRPARVVVAE